MAPMTAISGCLSLPVRVGALPKSAQIEASYQNSNDSVQQYKCKVSFEVMANPDTITIVWFGQ